MKLKVKRKTDPKAKGRKKRKVRLRKKVKGDTARPRLCVFRSSNHIYAQVIDDSNGKVLAAASSLKMEKKSGRELAKLVGSEIAKLATAKKIKDVVFDRGGYVYHGRVQVLADSARESGLNF
mgnify:CR=1 FL=1